MSSTADRPERPPIANLLEALEFRRNAILSIVAGTLFTAAVFLFFVIIPGTNQQLGYLLALAFTLATTVAGAIFLVLMAYAAFSLSRELRDDPA